MSRDALTEDIRRATKIVMPEEQIPPARMPLTAQAAQKSPLVAVSSKITSKLVELGVRVHTIGVDRVTSSFYYLAEGGGEDEIRIEGDLVQAVGAMLGERADNAAIERVLDGLPDRLLRSLSKDRLTELAVELAAALPKAAADGTGTQGVDLEGFEKALSQLIAGAEKYATPAKEIADKLAETNERRVDVPLFGDARKVSQGPFDLMVGDRKVSLGTYERWVMAHALGESGAASKPSPTTSAAPQAKLGHKADVEDALLASLEEHVIDADDKAHGKKLEAKKAEEEAAAKKRAEEEAAKKRKAEEEAAAAKKKAEEEASKKRKAEEEAAAAKKKAEEEAAAKKAEEEAAAKKAEEEAAAKKAEEEAAAKKAEEEAAAKKAEEEAAAKKKAEEEAAAKATKKAAEDEAGEKKADEKKAKKADEKKAAKAEAEEKGTPSAKAKLAKAEPEKSSSMTWIALILAVVAALAAWRFFFNK